MASIMDLPEVTSLNSDDVLLMYTNSGTYKYPVSNLEFDLALADKDRYWDGYISRGASTTSGKTDATVHRSMYRGKYLGNQIKGSQLGDLANGTFGDIWIGDYWTVNNTVFRVADFDYFYRHLANATPSNGWPTLYNGDFVREHHVVLVTDVYADATGSTMSAIGLFGELTNGGNVYFNATPTVYDNASTAKAAFDSSCKLLQTVSYEAITNDDDGNMSMALMNQCVFWLNEQMVYGQVTVGATTASKNGTLRRRDSSRSQASQQLALFRLAPEHIPPVVSRANYSTYNSSAIVETIPTGDYPLRNNCRTDAYRDANQPGVSAVMSMGHLERHKMIAGSNVYGSSPIRVGMLVTNYTVDSNTKTL